MKIIIFLATVLACCFAHPRIVKRQTSPFAFSLPADAEIIVGQINTEFDCTGQEYGFYADQNNNCQVFHICSPYTDAQGVAETRMWSFLCGEGTMFDQAQLVCNTPEKSLSCSEASNFYNINDYFKEENIGTQFRSGLNNIF